MRRQPDDGVGADDLPRLLDGQVVLPDVDAVGAGQARDVRAVVDDELGAGGVGAPTTSSASARRAWLDSRLVAELQQTRTAAQAGVGERPRIESRGAGRWRRR